MFPRRTIRVREWRVASFRACGIAGASLGAMLALLLAASVELSPLVMAGCVLSAVLTFLAFAMTKHILTGADNLVYYHHALAIVLMTALVLVILGRPILAYLDPLVLGLGLAQAIGRVGCLMAGCCCGRPARWGVRYHFEHVAAGFPGSFAHARLLPVQLIEATWSIGVVVSGSVILLARGRPGEALAWYIIGYGVGRFGAEFLRGDAARRSVLGISEAQWTAVLSVGAMGALGAAKGLPFHGWYLVALVGLAGVVIILGLIRWSTAAARRLSDPRHVAEVADIVDAGLAGDETAALRSTSRGIYISASAVDDVAARTYLYGLSNRDTPMDRACAESLAELIVLLRHPSASFRLIERPRNVFLVIVTVSQHERPPNSRILVARRTQRSTGCAEPGCTPGQTAILTR
jgi:prolipoprotein diacylglyceryltransferase